MGEREREARIRERLERDYVVNMDDGEWLLERVERYREALEKLAREDPYWDDPVKMAEIAHRALNEGEDDGEHE